MTDRMNRITALMITLVIAFIGYGGTIFVSNPFGTLMIVFMIFVGLSEVGCVITSGVLIAEQTPEKIRGSVIGIFNLSGAIGILVASKLGGYLYDHWSPAGPFVLFGGLAMFVCIWALVVRKRIKPVNPGAGKDHALDDLVPVVELGHWDNGRCDIRPIGVAEAHRDRHQRVRIPLRPRR